MIDSTKKIVDATPLDDISGLKFPRNKSYSLKEIYVKKADNRDYIDLIEMHKITY